MLAGHEHQPNFQKITASGNEYLMLDAGATNPPGSEKRSPHCYNWIEFELVQQQQSFSLGVRVYPRVWIHERASFGPDQNRIGGATSEYFSVACRNFKPIDRAATPSAEAINTAPTAINEEEPAAMPEEERFAKLTYFFWRYLDWQQRYGVLAKMDILPKGLDRPVPQLLERNALASARTEEKLAAVWDAVMEYVPGDEREQNPFREGRT
jgi:hypothetical protein